MTTQVLDEQDVRRIVREEVGLPTFVHQRNVDRVAGIPSRQYLRDAHAKRFPAAKERRLVVARTTEVLAYYELRVATAQAPVANDANSETIEFARVGARRVAR